MKKVEFLRTEIKSGLTDFHLKIAYLTDSYLWFLRYFQKISSHSKRSFAWYSFTFRIAFSFISRIPWYCWRLYMIYLSLTSTFLTLLCAHPWLNAAIHSNNCTINNGKSIHDTHNHRISSIILVNVYVIPQLSACIKFLCLPFSRKWLLTLLESLYFVDFEVQTKW